jgi:hypothetical protein
MNEAMHDTMDVNSMFPYETTYARVVRNGLWVSIFIFIASCRAFDWKIINKDIGDMGNFVLKNESGAVLELDRGIGVSLGHGANTKETERCHKGSEVTTGSVKFVCVES